MHTHTHTHTHNSLDHTVEFNRWSSISTHPPLASFNFVRLELSEKQKVREEKGRGKREERENERKGGKGRVGEKRE